MTQQRGRLTPVGVNNRCWIQLFFFNSLNQGSAKRFWGKTWSCGKMKCTGLGPLDSWRWVILSAECVSLGFTFLSMSLIHLCGFRPSVSICPEGICVWNQPSMKWSFMSSSKLIMRYSSGKVFWRFLKKKGKITVCPTFCNVPTGFCHLDPWVAWRPL